MEPVRKTHKNLITSTKILIFLHETLNSADANEKIESKKVGQSMDKMQYSPKKNSLFSSNPEIESDKTNILPRHICVSSAVHFSSRKIRLYVLVRNSSFKHST